MEITLKKVFPLKKIYKMEHLYKKIRLVLRKYSLISLHLNSCIFQQCMQVIHQCFEKLLSKVLLVETEARKDCFFLMFKIFFWQV